MESVRYPRWPPPPRPPTPTDRSPGRRSPTGRSRPSWSTGPATGRSRRASATLALDDLPAGEVLHRRRVVGGQLQGRDGHPARQPGGPDQPAGPRGRPGGHGGRLVRSDSSPRRRRSSSTATTSGWPITAGSPSGPGPGRLGGPPPRRPRRPPGRHHRYRRLHRRPVRSTGSNTGASGPGTVPSWSPGPREAWAAWPWPCWLPRLRGGGQHRQDLREPLPHRPRGRRGHRPGRARSGRPAGPSAPNGGPGRWTAWAGPPWPPSCGPSATARPWRPAG